MRSQRRSGGREGARAVAATLVAAAAVVLWGCAPGSPARSGLLVTLEGTRLDALGTYGGDSTPNLDRLARHGVRYGWARTVAPSSRPAHASMMTGLFPPRHGVRAERGEPLADRVPTVAEAARGAGFQTAAFLSSRLLDRSSGLDQGFDTYDLPREAAGLAGPGVAREASEVVRTAAQWLRARDARRPFFVWVQLGDPFPPRPVPPGDGHEELQRRYRAERLETDRALGELIQTLRAERLLRSTFVVVVADHGEALGEHGEAAHGLGLWDATLRVPLVLCYRDGFGAGEESGETVSVVDLAPTLLQAMELSLPGPAAVPGGLDGLSLYYESVASDRTVYFESYAGWSRFGWSPLVGAADARGKLVRGARDELFDPRRDPGEREPLPAGAGGADEGRLRASIEAVHAAPRLGLEPPAVDERVLARLGELAATAPPPSLPVHPLPGELLPGELKARADPRDQLGEQQDFERARRAVQAGDHAGALSELEQLRARHPAAPEVLDALAESLAASGRQAEAVAVLRERLALPPEAVETHAALRVALTALGEDELARQHSVRSLELLMERQRRRGDAEAVRRTRVLLDRTRRQVSPDPEGLEGLGGGPRAAQESGQP